MAADKTAKRLSLEEWLARHAALPAAHQRAEHAHAIRNAQRLRAPADRCAIRV